MPTTDLLWQTRIPAEGYYASEVTSPECLPFRTYAPVGYEPNYPYPLLVFLHGHGSNEDQAIKLAPRLSCRNYVAISLRGPQNIQKPNSDRPGYTWESDAVSDEMIEDYVIRAVAETRREYHIHSERIYLVGVCEGAAMAYRLGLSMPDKLAGIISLNGHMPAPGSNRPLFRLPELRQLKVMIGHGIANSTVPLGLARRDYQVLYAAGLNVKMETYPTTHRLHRDMLRDVNRWIMKQISGDEY